VSEVLSARVSCLKRSTRKTLVYDFVSATVRYLAAVAITAATLVVASCASKDEADHEIATGSNALIRSVGGQPGSLDPHRAEDAFSYDVLRDLYEGLTSSSPEGEVIQAASSRWRVTSDGRIYTFELRDGGAWSNGDPVTASQFVTGFRRATDPATASGAADLLRAIVNAPAILRGELPPDSLGVRALDDRTLEIRLSHPVPYFPDILTNTVASPVHPSSLAASGGFSKPGSTITNGPYVLQDFVPGTSLTLKRNPRYWDRAAVQFDTVRYEFIADENAEYTRFRASEIDVTNTVPEQRFQELAEKRDARLQHRPTLSTFYFTLNTDRGPLRGKPGLREALSLAVDRDAITASVTRAGQVAAYSLVPSGVWNYEPQAYAWRESNAAERRARARKLYAEAGYSAHRPLRLRLLYNENELVQRVSIAVAAMWKEELGVETELVQMEFKAYLAARADPAQWDVVRVGWTADYNDASTFLDTMTAESPQNFGRWSSSEYARLLAEAAAETDSSRRRDVLQRAESLMLSDYPLLPVYFYVTRRLVQPRIAAPAINPMNRTYSRYFRLAP
jgi:oligopeptide transport system substrate-binding protein